MKILQHFFTLSYIFFCSTSIIFGQATGDYRTAKTGNWNDATVWEVFNGAWAAATASPDTNAGQVSVISGHTVTVTENLTVDSVYVNDGGSVVVDPNVVLTVGFNNDGPGLVLQGINALVVYGHLRNEGNIEGATSWRTVDFDPVEDTLVVKSGGVLEHARDQGEVPICKWEENSTFYMTGIITGYPDSHPQNYWHVIWDTPNATRADGRFNLYRNRIGGDFIVENNSSVHAGGDRDIRLMDRFPENELNPTYEDTVWFEGKVHLKTPPNGGWSRVALTGGGNTPPIRIVIFKDDIIVEDSCVFGRVNSQTDMRAYLYGDLIIEGGGTMRTGLNNPYQQKNWIFAKQDGVQHFTVGDGKGNSGYGNTVGTALNFQVAEGTVLDIGTSKIGDTLGVLSGFFQIDEGGTLKVSYDGENSGFIGSTGETGILHQDLDSLNGAPTVNGNSFALANNVVGSGTITYSASAIQNVSDAEKAYAHQWTVEPSSGIQSGDLKIGVSIYKIPTSADWQNSFVAIKYGGSGMHWENRGEADLIIDDLFGDVLGIQGATLTNVSDLAGVWSMGETSITGITSVESISNTIPTEFKIEQNYPNPFNPTTKIRFHLPAASDVSIKVFNLLGQEITTLFDGFKQAGSYEVSFDASSLSSGVYLYRVHAGTHVDVKRMLLLK